MAQETQSEFYRLSLRATDLRHEGASLIHDKKYGEAVTTLLQLIEVNRQLIPLASMNVEDLKMDGWFLLGKAYEGLNRRDEAIDALRHASYWDSNRGDLMTAGANVAFDLAVLLARQGRTDASKAAYYWGMRKLNVPVTAEPVPLIVVFDADSVGDRWAYNLTNLTAAARTGSSIGGNWDGMLEEALVARPDWYVPVVYQAIPAPSEDRIRLFNLALQKCSSDRDREWVNKARGFVLSGGSQESTDALPSGFEIRKSMKVLETWRLKLVQDHSALSVN